MSSSSSSLQEENDRLREELEHCKRMLRIESQSRALLERQASNAESLVDELSAAARARELNERRELVVDLELKDRTIAALQTEVDWLMSRFIAANATLGQLSNERAQIAHSNEQAQLELDVLRARLSEEETAFKQVECSLSLTATVF
jgi:regulator of replication initiation timing